MKIINKYPVLSNLEYIIEETIKFEFSSNQMQLNNFVVTVFGFKSDDLKSLVELIKKYYLNKQTVLLEEDNCIEILLGNIDESPDWGDWSTFFIPFDFEKYETNFTKKK